MEINPTHLRAAIRSLEYSIDYVENIDYRTKYGLSHEQAHRQRQHTLSELKEAKNYLAGMLKQKIH